MLIFSILISIIMVLDLVLRSQKKYDRFAFILVTFLLILGVSSIRSIDFGIDTPGYVEKYEQLKNISANELWVAIFDPLIKDPGFYLFSKIFSVLGLSPTQWLIALSGIFLAGFSYFTYQQSQYPLLSFLFLICVGLLYFSFSALRQTLSISLLLFSIPLMLKRRYISSISLIIIASFFHKSVIFFAALLPLAFLPIYRYTFIILIASISISQSLKPLILNFISILDITDYSAYAEGSSSLNWSGLIIQIVMLGFSFRFTNRENRSSRIFLNFAVISAALQSMSVVVGEFFRLSMYFGLAFAVLIPQAIADIKPHMLRSFWYTTIAISFISYFFYSGQFHNF